MFYSRPVPPPNQWIKIPRPDWHFPSYVAPIIGPKLQLPLRPRVLPYKLSSSLLRGIKPRSNSLLKLSNPLITSLFSKHPILDRIYIKRNEKLVPKKWQHQSSSMPKLHSSRIRPKVLPPAKMRNELWKRGYQIPMPSQYAIGCRRPVKLFDLPTQEFHFRHVHPQFGSFFDKWSQRDINWNDARNVSMMEQDIMTILMHQKRIQDKRLLMNDIVDGSSGGDQKVKMRSKLIRPPPYLAFFEKELMMAHSEEMRFIKASKNNKELWELGQERHSRAILDAYYSTLDKIDKYGPPKQRLEDTIIQNNIANKKPEIPSWIPKQPIEGASGQAKKNNNNNTNDANK